MEIDFDKVKAASTDKRIDRCGVALMFREYHRQLKEGLYHSYVHRAIQGTEVEVAKQREALEWYGAKAILCATKDALTIKGVLDDLREDGGQRARDAQNVKPSDG